MPEHSRGIDCIGLIRKKTDQNYLEQLTKPQFENRYRAFIMINLYLQLYKSKGIRLVFTYFINAHLFDLLHKTDTHVLVPLERMNSTSRNFTNSLMYMVSWTSTLKKAFKRTQNLFSLKQFDFVDLGSGKGKATLAARKFGLLGGSDRYFGIDFEKSLVEIARRNSIKLFGDEGHFQSGDVVDIAWHQFSQELVIYMYNPFNSIVLNQVIEKIKHKKVVVIYVNPVETLTLVENGFEDLYSFDGWHANLTYKILTNIKQPVRR